MTPECGAASRRSFGAPGDQRDVEGCDRPLHIRRHCGGRTHQRRRPRGPPRQQAPPSPSSETVTFDCADTAGKVTVAVDVLLRQRKPHTEQCSLSRSTGRLLRCDGTAATPPDGPFGSGGCGRGLHEDSGPVGSRTRSARASRCEARVRRHRLLLHLLRLHPQHREGLRSVAAARGSTERRRRPLPAPATGQQRPVAWYVICRAEGDPVKGRFYNPPVDGADGSSCDLDGCVQDFYLLGEQRYQRSVGCGSYPNA